MKYFEYYKTSSIQKQFWALYKMNQTSPSFVLSYGYDLFGDLNINILKKTFSLLLRRHEILRTNFEEINGEIMQRVSDDFRADFLLRDLSGERDAIKLDQKIFQKEISRVFALEKDKLLRIRLNKKDSKNYTLVIIAHHIIFDGWSLDILIDEMEKIYNSLLTKKEIKLPDLPIQYKDYSDWEQSKEYEELIKKQKKYWFKKFCGHIPVLDLPIDSRRLPEVTYAGNQTSIVVNKNTANKIKYFANKNSVTVFSFLNAVFSLMISKLSGQDDFVIGVYPSTRERLELQNLLGPLFNMLAIKIHVEQNATFLDFLNKFNHKITEAFDNKDYNFEQLIRELNLPNDQSRTPLFNVAFEFFKGKTINLKGIKFKKRLVNNYTAKVDLMVRVLDTGELNFESHYNSDLYTEKTMQLWLKYFSNLINSILKNPHSTIKSLSLLDSQTIKHFLTSCSTSSPYPKNKPIHKIFEEQAARNPLKIAVEFQREKLTYKELNERANRLANYLIRQGLRKGHCVGIMLDRSPDFIVANLAILKAGAICLIIDTSYPDKRIAYMLNDVKVKAVVTMEKIIKTRKLKMKVKPWYVDIKKESVDNDKNPGVSVNSVDLAYIIYTSGSTGQPKGVMLTHRGIVNQVFHRIGMLEVKENFTLCHSGPIVFITTPLQIYTALFSGCSLIVYDNEIIRDPRLLFYNVDKHKITAFELGTFLFDSYLISLSDKTYKKFTLKNLKKIFIAGSKLNANMAHLFYKNYPKIQLINAYGQTECSGMTLFSPVPKTGQVFEGKPTANNYVYVLDKNMKLVPPGVIGELYVSGDGLAKGYLNQLQKTKEVFLPNPFIRGAKIYRTGDFVKMSYDGNITYISRADQQIKVRGNRVEIGEIETVFAKYPGVKKTVILAKEDKNKRGDNYLIAYFTAKDKINQELVRDFLRQSLPEFMVPSFFIQLDEFPLSINGKIDKFSLPNPNTHKVATKFEPPKTDLEKKIAEIWKEVLKTKRVGINDVLFDLGGQSIKIVEISAKTKAKLGINVPVIKFFKYPTIKKLIDYIKNGDKTIIDKNFNFGKNNIKKIFSRK